MAEMNPNAYPEKKPDTESLQNQEVTDETLRALFGVASETALDGTKELDVHRPIVFQNVLYLADGRSVYVTRYFSANAGEVSVGDKMGDILLCDAPQDRRSDKVLGSQHNNYVNYYFINEGSTGLDDSVCQIEKHSFSCLDNHLLQTITDNHRAQDADYEFERQLGLRTVTESEAIDLMTMILQASQTNDHSI